jgi:D-aminopeptidase
MDNIHFYRRRNCSIFTSAAIKIVCMVMVFSLGGFAPQSSAQCQRVRDFGIEIGVLETGKLNAITDVKGVRVGQATVNKGGDIRTGVTAILPHNGNLYREKVPAAIYVGNGFGKLAGITQVRELGNIETPVILTNTLSVPTAADALIDYAISFEANSDVRSVNPVVGETNDGLLNDIRGRHVKKEHVIEAIRKAEGGPVEEGNTGAGTGTVCFGYKGGIGTSSRVLPESRGGYTVGVLVQTNFGGVLQVAGAPVGKELGHYYMNGETDYETGGSCMIVVATDAPLDSRNLERMAKRAMLGLGKTGGISSNGSGDYVIAFSVNEKLRIQHNQKSRFNNQKVLRNDAMSPLFMATIEATEEAILNSLFAAEDMKGRDGNRVKALPVKKVMELLEKYGVK